MPCTRNRVAELAGLLLEDADELLADALPLLLRLVDASRAGETILRLDVDERHLEVTAERLRDLARLVRAHEAVVDEDARQLVADRFVHEQRGDRRVDAARQRAENSLRADLGADPLDLLLDHRRGRPGRRHVGDPVEKFLRTSWPYGVWTTSGWNWTPWAPLRVLERRHRRGGRPARDRGALRWRDNRVAVAHPHGLALG